MRDRQAYLDAGRNDPGDAAQRREHPYDFVSLPAQAARGHAPPWNTYPEGLLSGTLELTYTLLTPMIVGSGAFDTAKECGLAGGDTPVRGMVRSKGKPVLPGSSWKGAVRSRFEAITRSRLGLKPRDGREPDFKVPGALKLATDGPGPYRVRLEDRRVNELSPKGGRGGQDPSRLSPADGLFGAMGYRGRVLPGEGSFAGPGASEPLAVAPLDSPNHHRLAKPGKIENTGGRNLVISEVEGRKFYHDGDLVHQRRVESPQGPRTSTEYIDSVPAGATLEIAVRVESLSEAELGALLIAAGQRKDSGILRFGGHKPNGLGKVELSQIKLHLNHGPDPRRWKRSKPLDLDPDRLSAAVLGNLVDPAALAELHAITTTRRPAEPKR